MKKNLFLVLSILCFTFSFNSAFAVFSVTLTPSNHNGYSISCFGGVNGAINITVTGGASPYTYRWSTGATTQNVSGLASGYYQVTVTDNNLATCSGNVTLTQPTAMTLTITPSLYSPQATNISCYNCCNGYINISISGGVTAYSYSWSSGQTTANVTNLCKNSYTIIVTDANGCSKGDHQVMTEPDKDTWAQTGNSGSNPPTQFIGTTDNKDLVFKTNNSEALRIKANGDLKINSFIGGVGSKLLLSDSLGNIFSKQIFTPTVPCTAAPPTLAWTVGDNVNTQIANCYFNTGIGTTNPQQKLEVAGTLRISNNGNPSTDYIDILHNGGNAVIKSVGGSSLDINCNSPGKDVKICVGNGAGNTEIGGNVYLGNWNGSVGIGTTTPQTGFKLDVAGDAKVNNLEITSHIGTGNRFVYTDEDGFLQSSSLNFSQTAAAWEVQGNSISSGDFIGTTSNHDFVIKANSNEKMRVATDGNVTIITTPNSSDNSKRTVLGPLLDDDNGALGWGTSYIGFNAHRNASIHEWTANTDGSNNGGAAIWASIHGDLYFASITHTLSSSNTDQTGITDASMSTRTKLTIANTGRIGIATNTPLTRLDVRGNINVQDGGGHCIIYFPNNFYLRSGNPTTYDDVFKVNSSGYVGARGIRVTQGNFPDYVFKDDYKLMPLDELGNYIMKNQHLPDIPTACEVEDNGLDLGEMQASLVKKIEELTLYVIDLKKENDKLKIRIDALEKK